MRPPALKMCCGFLGRRGRCAFALVDPSRARAPTTVTRPSKVSRPGMRSVGTKVLLFVLLLSCLSLSQGGSVSAEPSSLCSLSWLSSSSSVSFSTSSRWPASSPTVLKRRMPAPQSTSAGLRIHHTRSWGSRLSFCSREHRSERSSAAINASSTYSL